MENSIKKFYKQWQDYIKNNTFYTVSDEDMPDDIKQDVLDIRKFLLENNIDPSSLYLISNKIELIDTNTNTNTNIITVTINYDKFV